MNRFISRRRYSFALSVVKLEITVREKVRKAYSECVSHGRMLRDAFPPRAPLHAQNCHFSHAPKPKLIYFQYIARQNDPRPTWQLQLGQIIKHILEKINWKIKLHFFTYFGQIKSIHIYSAKHSITVLLIN